MKVIGLTGGIGTGKSTVAGLLMDRGWTLLSSDATAHALVASNADVRKALIDIVGSDAYLPDGVPNRPAIAAAIFGDSDAHHQRKHDVERVIHPRVLDHHFAELESMRKAGVPLVCIESALLYEVELEDAFDFVIVVDAIDDVRIERVMQRSALTRQQVEHRINEQMPMSEKRAAADFVIANNASLNELAKATNLVATIVEAMPDSDTSNDKPSS